MADQCRRVIAATAAIFMASVASAQTFTWTATVNGLWDDPVPWGGVDFPQDGADIAIIAVEGAAFVVDLNGFGVTIAELELTSEDATLNGAAGGTVLVNDQVTFSNATLEDITSFVSAGTLLFDSDFCDDLCDIFFSQTGPIATWQNVGDIQLLGATTFDLSASTTFNIVNAQTLSIDDGATLTNNGTIAKSGPGTTLLERSGTLGVFQNPGTVELTDGALDTDALDLVGDTVGEGTWIVRGPSTLNLLGQSVVTNQASVTLDGPGASFPAFETNIAFNDPTGVIALEGARTLATPGDFTNDGLVDVGGGSVFTVDLGSSFTNFTGGDTIDGGQLDLEGTFQFAGASIAAIDADVILDGPGSGIVDESFADALVPLDTIAPGGSLALANGRDLTVGAPMFMVEGALLVGPEFGGDFSILTAAGDIDQPSGITLLDAGTIMHGGSYALSGSGQLRGNGTVTGPLFNSGRIAPGFSPGELLFQPQLFIEPPGLLEIELGGIVPVIEHDRVLISGTLDFDAGLAGTLEAQLIDGFVPNPGDFFDVIIANQINGQFQNVVAPNLPCELAIEVEYLGGKEQDIVRLVIIDNCVADCNDDGKVDALDFVCFQLEWIEQTPCGDCNGDGAFNILDFVCFQNAWTAGCP